MLSGLANLLFAQEAPKEIEEQNEKIEIKETEDDWVLVEMTDPSAGVPTLPVRLPSPVHRPPTPSSSSSRSSSPIPESLSIHTPETIMVTPPASPSQMDGSWFVTPPPCFAARRPVYLETSPLENLLIEHPSMSVYTFTSTVSCISLPQHPSSANSVMIPSSLRTDDKEEPRRNRGKEGRPIQRRSPRRPPTIVAKAGLLEHIENIKPMQKAAQIKQQSDLRKTNIDRQNKTRQFEATVKHPRRRNRWLNHSGANVNRKC